jgi:TolA-binding protein
LPVARSRVVAFLALASLLQACAAVPAAPPVAAAPIAAVTPGEAPPAAAAASGDEPQLTLNMPQHPQCDCTQAPVIDYTFLEKGYRALLDGEYQDAMQHFQRYQRLESSPRADLEAGIAIAYVRMLPRSAFYDPVAARNEFKVLREQNAKKLKVHDYTRLMRQSLLNLLELQDDIDKLTVKNATLKEDLKKREEALKRLRDLTLNQKGAEQ